MGLVRSTAALRGGPREPSVLAVSHERVGDGATDLGAAVFANAARSALEMAIQAAVV
jgi:hypothetical protein